MKLPKLSGPETGLLAPQHEADWNAHEIDFYEDVAYGTGGGHDLFLDLMVPRKANTHPRPALIWVHGGGWSAPQLTKKYRPTQALIQFCELGFVCASIDYRLVTEAPFPAPIEDCKCAVRFMRANAKELGIDPDRIGIWGESAGGQLAALVGASPSNPALEGNGGWSGGSSRVQAVCDWYCGGDMTHFGAVQTALVQERAKELGIELSGMDRDDNGDPSGLSSLLFGGPAKDAPQLAMDISPIFYVKEQQPPYLLMHGDSDTVVPLEFSYNFYDALLANGHDATFVVIPRQGHGFFKGDGYYDIIYGFFQKYLQ